MLGLNQTELAKSLCVTQSAIAKLEAGKRPISEELGLKIQARFGVAINRKDDNNLEVKLEDIYGNPYTKNSYEAWKEASGPNGPGVENILKLIENCSEAASNEGLGVEFRVRLLAFVLSLSEELKIEPPENLECPYDQLIPGQLWRGAHTDTYPDNPNNRPTSLHFWKHKHLYIKTTWFDIL